MCGCWRLMNVIALVEFSCSFIKRWCGRCNRFYNGDLKNSLCILYFSLFVVKYNCFCLKFDILLNIIVFSELFLLAKLCKKVILFSVFHPHLLIACSQYKESWTLIILLMFFSFSVIKWFSCSTLLTCQRQTCYLLSVW